MSSSGTNEAENGFPRSRPLSPDRASITLVQVQVPCTSACSAQPQHPRRSYSCSKHPPSTNKKKQIERIYRDDHDDLFSFICAKVLLLLLLRYASPLELELGPGLGLVTWLDRGEDRLLIVIGGDAGNGTWLTVPVEYTLLDCSVLYVLLY